jgi:TetR/AcrR family acrAB operon transcriptional repressor
LREALRQLATDPQTRRVFEVATHMVEYVDSLCEVRTRHQQMRDHAIARFRQVLLKSAATRGVRLALPAIIAAHGLHALITGLIQDWLLETAYFDLETAGVKVIDAYLRGIGLE